MLILHSENIHTTIAIDTNTYFGSGSVFKTGNIFRYTHDTDTLRRLYPYYPTFSLILENNGNRVSQF